jgi:anti-sigma regulatory factor (Ser/Thr protein kinase)
MDARTWSHTQRWECDPAHVARARDFVTGHLRAHGLDAIVEALQLVVSELATNAVVHTRSPFTVTLRRLDQMVVLLVSDGSDLVPHMQPFRPLPTSGMGLQVVGALSESWGVQAGPDGGKSVWAAFDAVPPVAGLPASSGDGYLLGPWEL